MPHLDDTFEERLFRQW